MFSLVDTIINQLIGAIIGTIVSFVMSWYFYKKADFPARVTGEMIEDVLAATIQSKFRENFEFVEVPMKNQLPKDKDTPHIIKFLFTTKTPKQGESVLALFRVEDTGLDFGRPKDAPPTEIHPNIIVADTSRMGNYPVVREGHGYYSCRIEFPADAFIGEHTVVFRLTDYKGKSHTQFVKFHVISAL